MMSPDSALRKILGWLVLIGGAIIFIAWAFSQWSARKTAEKRHEVAEGQGGASLDAAAEAMNTSANMSAQAQEHDRIARAGQDAVRAAPEGKKGMAALRAMCEQRAYRDHPSCKAREPGQ